MARKFRDMEVEEGMGHLHRRRRGSESEDCAGDVLFNSFLIVSPNRSPPIGTRNLATFFGLAEVDFKVRASRAPGTKDMFQTAHVCNSSNFAQ